MDVSLCLWPIPLPRSFLGAAGVHRQASTWPCRRFLLCGCLQTLEPPHAPIRKLCPKPKRNCSPPAKPKPPATDGLPNLTPWTLSEREASSASLWWPRTPVREFLPSATAFGKGTTARGRAGGGPSVLTVIMPGPTQHCRGSGAGETKTHEIPRARQLFQKLDRDGRPKSASKALHTQAQTQLQRGLEHDADYLLSLQDNPAKLPKNPQQRVDAPPARSSPSGPNGPAGWPASDPPGPAWTGCVALPSGQSGSGRICRCGIGGPPAADKLRPHAWLRGARRTRQARRR